MCVCVCFREREIEKGSARAAWFLVIQLCFSIEAVDKNSFSLQFKTQEQIMVIITNNKHNISRINCFYYFKKDCKWQMANCKLQTLLRKICFSQIKIIQAHTNTLNDTQPHFATLSCLIKIVFANPKHGNSFQRWLNIVFIWLRDAFTAIQ